MKISATIQWSLKNLKKTILFSLTAASTKRLVAYEIKLTIILIIKVKILKFQLCKCEHFSSLLYDDS